MINPETVEWLSESLSVLPSLLAFTLGVTAVAVAVGLAIERSSFGRGRVIYARRLARGQYRWELIATLRFCLLASVVFAGVFASGVLGAMSDGWASGLYSFVVLFVGFDVFYYFFHRVLHHPKLIRFHRLHHKSRVMSPLTGFSLGWVESFGWIFAWVVLALVASYFYPLSLTGIVSYLVVLFVANIIGHTNVDWSPRIFGSRGLTWGNHPVTFHALHHARYDGHFSFAITALDRIFASEWDDWRSLFYQVLKGRPMKRLQERGAVK